MTCDNDDITIPPGLVGECTNFIGRASARPCEALALAGSIGLISAITGRSHNVKGMGLNHFVVGLAPTGTGKSFIGRGIRTIMRHVVKANPKASIFIGPPEISSGPALLKTLSSRHIPSFVSIWGEIGLRLKQITDERAPFHLAALHRLILDLFTASSFGEEVGETVYSDPTKNSPSIKWPALSILGEGTQTSFYPYITARSVELGLIPRLNLFEYDGKKPLPINDESHLAVPGDDFIQRMGRLVSKSLALNDGESIVEVTFTADAEELQGSFKRYCYGKSDNSPNSIERALWTRAWAKLVKLAALVAVGIDCDTPTITVDMLEWARVQIDRDIRKLLAKFENGEVGVMSEMTDHDRQDAYVLKKIVRWTTCKFAELPNGYSPGLHAAKFVPYRYLSHQCLSTAAFKVPNPTAALKRAIQTLIDEERIARVPNDALLPFNVRQECYMLTDASAIDV